MSDQETDQSAPSGASEAQVASAPAFEPIGANELRLLAIPRRLFGYDQGDVDEALDRAAHTIDDLMSRAKQQRDELDELHATVATLKTQLAEPATHAAPPAQVPAAAAIEAAVGEVLTRAHSLAEKHLRKAREEASTIVTAARVDADSILSETNTERARLERLLHVAETEVEQARYHARAMLAQSPSASDSQLAGALTEAEQRLAELRAESARLETKIDHLRGVAGGHQGKAGQSNSVHDNAVRARADLDSGERPREDVLSELHARIGDVPGV